MQRKRKFECSFRTCDHVSVSVIEHERHHFEAHKRQQPPGGFFACPQCPYRSNVYRMARPTQHLCVPVPAADAGSTCPQPEWDEAPVEPQCPEGSTLVSPVIAASEFANSLSPLVASIATQLRGSCLIPWGVMSTTFASFSELLSRAVVFAVRVGVSENSHGQEIGNLSDTVSDIIKQVLLHRPDQLRTIAFSSLFPPTEHRLEGSSDSIYVLDLVGWLHHLAKSDESVWKRLKSPPIYREQELTFPTDGEVWKRIGNAQSVCVILSIDGMNWADALRVGGHNGKTIAVYITVAIGPEFLSYSSTYSVAMFAPASLLARHTRSALFAPLFKQLRSLQGDRNSN